MSLFSRLIKPTPQSARPPLVEVVYRSFASTSTPNTTPGYGYVYKWSAPIAPQVGMKVWAPVGGEDMPAVILTLNPRVPKGYTRAKLSTITRLPTKRELRRG